MKQFFIMIAFVAITVSVNAQEPNQPSTGDLYNGLARKIEYDRMIPPYGVEVSFNKTVHIIFPAAVSYVDLGSANIIAGKADGSENVIRVKAAVQGFERETNFSVITEEGNFYSFNVKYADDPEKLNVEMKDFIHDGEAVNRPNNSLDIYLKELGNESPKVVYLIMKSIYKGDKREIKHIGSKRFGVQLLLKGIYTYNDFLYFYIQTQNTSQVPFDMDFIRIKIVDKKIAKRTAIQEQVIYPVRAYRYNIRIPGKKAERTVFALPKFTIPDGKQLVVELYEKNGGRHQRFVVENEDIVHAKVIDNLKVK
ncbi:MAG: conjugative transposon protein TraN [Tannerella sp.]|nr:conjugative transposon protein TraN [Tannerella sp.]